MGKWSLLWIVIIVLGAAAVAGAGNIPGELRNARGEKISNQYTVCAIEGTNSSGANSGGQRTSNDSASYGVFYWGSMQAGNYTQGIVGEVLSPGGSHPRGIKVRLTDGTVGRVQWLVEE